MQEQKDTAHTQHEPYAQKDKSLSFKLLLAQRVPQDDRRSTPVDGK
jgi:hypothetical protein